MFYYDIIFCEITVWFCFLDFDCPTDEIIVEQPTSVSGQIIVKCEKDDTLGENNLPLFAVSVDSDMSAQLATQTYSSPRELDNIGITIRKHEPLTLEEGDDDNRTADDTSTDLDGEHVGRDVIVIPANANSVELQRAIQQVCLILWLMGFYFSTNN